MMKMADFVYEQLFQLQREYLEQKNQCLSEFCRKIEHIVKNTKSFQITVSRNWVASAKKIQTRTCRNLKDLDNEIDMLKIQLDQKFPSLPKLSDVLAELMQLEDEYGRPQYNWKEKTLSVTTEPIVLEDVALGSFEIRLFLDRISRLAADRPYRIIALDPHPAGTDRSVTHPHVSSQCLCEGDGCLPIRQALEQGRLCDFFSLVMGILNTY